MNLSVHRLLVLACWVIAPVGASAASVAAAPEARQFDFMVGQWQVSGELKVSGAMALFHGNPKLAGGWKAWRAADGQGIEDELTLTDASGTVLSAVHFTRKFSPDENCWKVTGRDTYKGALPTPATARWQGDEILMTSSGTTPEGKHYRNRTHYLAITPVSFRMVQDRSYDEGKSWDTGTMTLDVRRTGN
ncbi:hypothetical protein RCH09_002953 [Actimicrobium sp. GrIS 1.19]|uniref:hypothetical protein n=1 Tax=Actimicrobium sp. GrIS 1.19 TaxID=3071708 RepID=UPI002E02AA67|nr:hypothetical protein [Actimicrobium sp. GrIS 1.19]